MLSFSQKAIMDYFSASFVDLRLVLTPIKSNPAYFLLLIPSLVNFLSIPQICSAERNTNNPVSISSCTCQAVMNHFSASFIKWRSVSTPTKSDQAFCLLFIQSFLNFLAIPQIPSAEWICRIGGNFLNLIFKIHRWFWMFQLQSK